MTVEEREYLIYKANEKRKRIIRVGFLLVLIIFLIYLGSLWTNRRYIPVRDINWGRSFLPYEEIIFEFNDATIVIDNRYEIRWHGRALSEFFNQNRNMLSSSRNSDDDIKVLIQFTFANWTLRFQLGGDFPYNGQHTRFYVDASISEELLELLHENNLRIPLVEVNFNDLISNIEQQILMIRLQSPYWMPWFRPSSQTDIYDMITILELLDENRDVLVAERQRSYYQVMIFLNTFDLETNELKFYWNSNIIRMYTSPELNQEIRDSLIRNH